MRQKIKNHDQRKYKFEKKMKPGVRDIGIQLKYGDLFESYTVTTVEQRI